MCQEKNSLVELINKRLAQKSWKPARLAKEANVKQPAISRLLNNSKNIGVDNIYKILKALDLLKIDGDSCKNKEEILTELKAQIEEHLALYPLEHRTTIEKLIQILKYDREGDRKLIITMIELIHEEFTRSLQKKTQEA